MKPLRLFAAIAAFAALAIIGIASLPAQAQFGIGPSPQDCAMTSGTSRMCVTNNSPFMITGIEAGTFMQPDGHWVPIPGGFIRPGQTVMVNFPPIIPFAKVALDVVSARQAGAGAGAL